MKKMMTKTNGSKQKIIIRTVILAFAAISILITLMTIPAALNSQMATLDSLAIPQPTPPHQALEKARADELVQALADATENILDDSMDLDRVNTTKAQIVTGFSRRGSMAGKSGRQVADLFLADAKTVITDADINARLAIEFEDVLKAGDVDGNALQAADVDAAFFHRGEKVSYFFKGSQYYRLTGTNVDAGYPKALPGEWRGLPASFHSGIDAAVQDPYSNNIYFFKGNAYSAFNSVSKTAYPGYDNVTLPGGWQGLPAAFHNGIDAALDEDGSIILYKGGRQLVITNERAVRESDIPASVLAGGSIDAAFKYSNGRNYFFSGSRVARAIGSNVEPGWPNAIKDVWTGVGSDRTQATTGNGSATNSPPTGNQPPLEPKTASCGTGYIAGSDGSCVLEVKFYQRDNMSAAEARDMAARNGWSLATREQVITAWEKAKLHVFAFARTSSGDMCVPIQSNVNNFTRGPNCGDNRGNQGFLYVLSGATAGQPGNSTSNASTNPAPVNNSAAVRQYLDNLRYNEAQLLAEPTGDGEVIPQPRGKLPNKMGSGAVIVCTEVRNSADADYKEISILSPTGSTVYPGALLYANQDLRRGTPRGLKRFKRAPITVTLELAGEKKRMVLTDSENLYAEYQEKLGAELEKWNARNQTLPADLRYSNGARAKYYSATAYSKKQIGIALKVDARWSGGDANLDVAFANDAEKNDVVARFEQIFYTLTYEAPTAPEKVFDPSVTVDELRREASFDSANAPAYVSSVNYGRTIFLRMSASSNVTNVDAKAAFEYGQQQATGIRVEANAKYDEILRSSELTAVIIGGNAENALNIIGPATPSNIRSVITGKNAIYSRSNPGVPISYVVNFLKDDRLASIKSSTEYNSTDCKTLNNFKLRVRQLDGAYVADTTLAYRDDACKIGGPFQQFRLNKPVNENLIPGAGSTIATFTPFNGDRSNICFYQFIAKPVGWFQDFEIPGTATDIRLYLAAHFFINDFRALSNGNVILTPADFKLATNPSGDNVPLCINMRGTTFSRFAEKEACK